MEKIENTQNQALSRKLTQHFGGIGPCGLPCCCHRFLQVLPKIKEKEDKKDTKEKNTLTTGLCGQIQCCILFEKTEKQAIPEKILETPATATTAQRSKPSQPTNLQSHNLPKRSKPTTKLVRKIVIKKK